MFWKLTFRQPSAIDTLLNEEDCNLHDILDEDNVLQELKSQDKKLVEFFVRPDILEQLVKLVTLEPEENVEDKVKFKYPHLACELLTCEVESIINSLSTSENLMGRLWAFLDKQETLNPLVGSFISKVLTMLLNQRASVIFDYARDKEGFILAFLNHLGTSAIMDLLLQMVAAPDSDQCRIDLAWWLKEQGIVEKLVDFVHPSADSEQCANASQTLCDMIRLSRESEQMAGPIPLLGTLESEVTMKRLLDNMFSSEVPSDVVIVSGVTVLLTAIERRQSNILSPAPSSSFMVEEVSQNREDAHASVSKIVAIIIPRLTDFHNVLVKLPDVPPMLTTVGVLDPPLGNTRLQVVKLFCALVQCNDAKTNREFATLKTFSTLMDLFFKFPWNNFLHSQVEGCIRAALFSTTANSANDGGSDEQFSLKYHILHDCQLVKRLLQGEEDNKKCSSQVGGNRQGYMGHLIKIVNQIVLCGESDCNLGQIINDTMEEDIQKSWKEFISGTVADTNRKNETNLGGNRPLTSSMDDSDDDFDQLTPSDNELDKAYQQYQEVKYVTAFVDDFGVDDNLRFDEEPYSETFTELMNISCATAAEEEQSTSSALFEAVCNEKIEQFDDSKSDEEESSTWADREVTFTSPLDRQSLSSDEDDNSTRQREFQTSFEEENTPSPHKAALYITASPNTLSQVTGRGDGNSDNKMEIISQSKSTSPSWQRSFKQEDLSGVTPMDAAAGLAEWTKEPVPGAPPSPHSNWADFSCFNTAKSPQSTVQQLNKSTEQQENKQEEAIPSPPRHDTTLYSKISGEKEAAISTKEPGAVGMETTELSSVDDITSQEQHESSHHANTSSDEDCGNNSTDSEDERSGMYKLNTSDQECLLQSPPARSLQQSNAVCEKMYDKDAFLSVGMDFPQSETNMHQFSSNGTKNPPKTGVMLEDVPNVSYKTKDKRAPGKSNSHDHTSEEETVAEDRDLSTNFDFLAQQGLLSDSPIAEKLANKKLERKREGAMEACKQYDQEVQRSRGTDLHN